MKKRIISGACLGLLCLGNTAFAEDMSVNRLLASQCAQCHGTNGHAVGDMDGLAGESAGEIREEMLEMRSEGTPGDIMEHQALGYTEDQIRRIAAYFGSRAGAGDGGSGGNGSGGDTGSGGSGSDSGSGSSGSDDDEHNEEHKGEKREYRKRRESGESGDSGERRVRKTRYRERDDD